VTIRRLVCCVQCRARDFTSVYLLCAVKCETVGRVYGVCSAL